MEGIGTDQRSASAIPGSSQFRLDRADWLGIAVLVALGATARLVFLIALPPLLHLDSDSYFEITQRLWRGEGFGDLSRRPPLYPMFLWLTGRSATAGLFPVVLLQHVLGIATVVLFYLLARRMLSPRMRPVAVVSCLFLAVIPYPIIVEHSILSESLFTFLLAAAAYSLLAWWQEDRGRYAWACGALLALAALTRPIAVGVFPLWAALLFLLQGRRRATGFLLRAGLAWSALLLPLLICNYSVMGSFALERSLGRNLISVSDRWVNYEGGIYPQVKSVYRPFRQQKRGPDAVVVYAAMPELRRATGWNDTQIDRALAAIAWEGIRAHPWEYAASRLRRLPLLFRDPGPSQRYVLQPETYLPFVEFVGQRNPDLVSRSVTFPRLQRARFETAGRMYQALSLDLTSGGWIVMPLLGIVGVLLIERRRAAWLLATLPAYLWLGTIFLQPPSARYRLPTLPWEILLAVAGFWFVWQAAAWLVRRTLDALAPAALTPAVLAPAAFAPGSGKSSSPRPFLATFRSDASFVWIATLAIVVFLGGRALLSLESEPILRTADLISKQSSGQMQFPQSLLRQLPVAGRTVTVLYWNESSPERQATVSAEAVIAGGGSYSVRAFYSCQTAACAGSQIEMSALDEHVQTLALVTAPLAQERIDNDWFWDQLELRISAPSSARRLRLELRLKGGMGSLVIPWIAVRAPPTLW